MGIYKSLTMSFGKAIEKLKEGQRITRLKWDNKDKQLFYVNESLNTAFRIAPIYDAYIAIKDENNHIFPWTATSEDILAEDWTIVIPQKDLSEMTSLVRNNKDNHGEKEKNVIKKDDKCTCKDNKKDDSHKCNHDCGGSQECQKKCLNECHKLKTPVNKSKKIQAIKPTIVVEIFKGKPYYSIVWYDGKDNDFHTGYSSYKLSNCLNWLKENFETIDISETVEESICELLHNSYLDYFLRGIL